MPLCDLPQQEAGRKHLPPQTQPCQNRVACVRHPVNSAQPKVTGEPGGRKVCRIKAGGRFAPPGQRTPPRRAGRGLSVGGRFYPFLAVKGGRKQKEQRENRMVPEHWKVDLKGGFRAIWRRSTRGSFFTPWNQLGGLFLLCSYSRRNNAESRRGYAQKLIRRKQRKGDFAEDLKMCLF